MDIAIMIEGQNGLNWPRWKKIVQLVEDLGFAGLYRSDHFTNSNPPDIDSLDLWVSFTWLAGNTKRIEFGPLVTPFSFRHPVHTARMASAIDDLSNGRLTLGLGAGWQDREHENFGFPLLDLDGRFRRMEEGLEVVTRLLQSDQPSDFSGEFYTLEEAVMVPRPNRPGGPPILSGILLALTWIYLYRTLSVSTASYMTLMSMMTPIMVSVLAMLFLGERLVGIQLAGAGMIILSAAVIYLSDIAYT
ncbi:MAG: LLM class flavin-dependent oxidoreductase [Anaerolineales bacterium]|uniref:LLM class flavin-dependent oxidoreductase n=1 Tax=Candidatus Desulfolinea nitratireducens TaxID=2841698 RepID=A0A8J6NKL2_9CHLR|nr:LLM class flavin-dependent oxidoreductase [Candidatus Desulfolinea nitratireducens]MBL6961075.1 LLM class flavin-dependent oxidoreductase [Anaerolineales bacterium]